MFNNGGYNLSDIAAVTGANRSNNDGGFGGDFGAWWIIILFLFVFCGWGNGNWGGNGGSSGTTTREEIAYGFDMNGLDNSVRGVQQGLCDGFYAMNTSILNGFSGVQNAMCQNTNAITAQLTNMTAQNASCCCETQRQLERGFCDLNYNLATQSCDTRRTITDSTRDIIDNNNAGIREILNFLTQDKIASLQAENQTLKFAASQTAQNQFITQVGNDIVNTLRPAPVPAFNVPNPYATYGWNSGCGCCNNVF